MVDPELTVAGVVRALEAAGFPGGRREAEVIWAACGGDVGVVRNWLARRVEGEPLEWLTGEATFCGEVLHIEPGLYVPRPQSEPLARRAVQLLPRHGLAADVATGCGALGAVLARKRPWAKVVTTDIDPQACGCARGNGVEVYQGDLAAPIPAPMWGCFDVVVAVVPYVPSGELEFLPRDVRRFEPQRALDGGKAGLDFLSRLVGYGPSLLKPGGSMLLELGGAQDEELRPLLAELGLELRRRLVDSDGDLRGIELRLAAR